jgi:hypothetical protein
MEETDVGRMLAAAAPATDAVPPVGDLAGRARSLGRRRRVQVFAARGGGAGLAVAAVAGMVVALGGFGGAGGAKDVSAGSGGGAGQASTPAPGSLPVGPIHGSLPPGVNWATSPTQQGQGQSPVQQAVDNPAANKKVTDAVKAALPAQDAAGLSLFRGDGLPVTYGADFHWGQQSGLIVSVAVMDPSTAPHTPSACQTDPHHCTTGTATLRGDQVTWEYDYADPHAPSLNVYDDKGKLSYLVSFTGPTDPQPPGLDVLKGVGLNEQVADALVAAIPKH